MIDLSKPAALTDGDCTFAAVATIRDEKVNLRQLRHKLSPRLAVVADAHFVAVVARFSTPMPPRRAIGIALHIDEMLFNQFGVFSCAIAPLGVLPTIRIGHMDRYRLGLSNVGPLDLPAAPLTRDYMIPRTSGIPLLVITPRNGDAAA